MTYDVDFKQFGSNMQNFKIFSFWPFFFSIENALFRNVFFTYNVPVVLYPPAKQSFRGYIVFSMSGILSFRQYLRCCSITLIAFVRFCSNLHHTLTIRQCIFNRKIGAEGLVLQELCHFVILKICLYYD